MDMMSHPNNARHFPALAPGPPRMFAPQMSTAVTKPKKNSTACLACKAAKRKCSGPDAPCKACRAANTLCHFDPSRDLRRKVAVKRTIHELTKYKDLLISLLGTVESADKIEVDKIWDMIQRKVTFEELSLAVGGPETKFGDPSELSAASKLAIAEYGDQPLEVSRSEAGRSSDARRTSDAGSTASSPDEVQPMNLQRPTVSPYARITLESLCDIPLFEVPARPWTEVTDDDYLVSHLVSLYFTWDHPCSQFLDQRTFLTHMKQKGGSKSEFCTPILVNSLLSLASTHSDSPDVLSSPDNAFSRGQRFFDEAQRLWQAEEEISLPNIQALLLMCCVFKFQGRAVQSWAMLGQAAQLAQEMRLFDAPISQDRPLSEMERVRTITAWGIFNLSSQMSVEQRRIGSLAFPMSDITLCGNDDFDWTPYPRSNKITYHKKPARLPEVRQGLVEVTKMMSDVQKLISERQRGTSFDELWTKAQGPYDRLTDWLQRWPTVSEMQTDPVPQILLLRIKCLQAIMSLFEELNDPNQPQFAQQARYYQTKSAYEMAQCFRVHRQAYGLKYIPSEMADATQRGLQVLAHQIQDSDESRQAFMELCRFGMAFSYTLKQTANVVHEIRNSAVQLQLPAEAIAILEDKGYES